MDEQFYQEPIYEPLPQPVPQRNGLASASLTLGICSIIFSFLGISFILGAIGIVLALLSRGAENMAAKARTGLVTSVIGVILSVTILIASFTYLVQTDQMQNMLDDYRYYYENEISAPDADSF